MPDQLFPSVQTGSFAIWSEDGLITFTSNFGDGPAIVTEGYAGWDVVDRPKEVGITVWKGRKPLAIEIPFLLDYWFAPIRTNPGVDCENEVDNLERLCGIGGHAQPAVCKVDGGGLIPHDWTTYKGHSWVIEQVSWDKGMEIRSGTSKRRLRCGGMITIRQFLTPSDILHRIGSNDRAGKPRRHRVRRGDTLGKIALKYYGDANKWKKIANANKMRDPRSLKINQLIRIP